jgi:ketosteroid isomerase-like protein
MTISPHPGAAARTTMFADIDRMDAAAWASYLASDVVMRFGNADPVRGREACREALDAFYGQIGGLRHDVVERWDDAAATIVEANVTYTRTDGEEVTVPVVTIYRTDGGDLISDYRVFIDLAPVFASGQ